jgi:glycosyltransferase involved in cell wall biosynthesis
VVDIWYTVREILLKNKDKILFIYPRFSSFVRTDYEILSEEYNVLKHNYLHKKQISIHILSQIKLLFWLLQNISNSKAVYIWFADYHSFLPIMFAKLFRKKSYLVLGGYDVTYIPEYNYGSFNNPIRAFCAKGSIQNASVCLAVSDNIKSDAEKLIKRGNIEILYTGYSGEKFNFNSNDCRSGVLSVIGASTNQRMYIKGVDLIVETAKVLPEIQFTLIAVGKKILNDEFGKLSNIEVIDELDQSELIKYYQKTSVYIQLSLREGLPNSVCEAMLCGTIPVGTNAGGIPIAIGDCGFISQTRNPNEIAKLISSALDEKKEFRNCVRQRIIDNFSLEFRRTKLLSTIKNYIK